MQLFSFKMPDNFNLYQWGDSHDGTIAQARPSLIKAINMIKKDPIGYWVHVGDAFEGRAVDDPRYDIDINTTPIVFKQVESVQEDIYPIRKKGLVLLQGNHDFYSRKVINLTEYLCKQLGIGYGTWSSKIEFKDSKNCSMGKIFITHGSEGSGPTRSRAGTPSRRAFNEAESLKNLLYPAANDVCYYGCGHFHRQILYVPEMGTELQLYDDGKELHQKWSEEGDGPDTKYYGCSGAFLKQFVIGASTYAERNLYRPVDIGMIKLEWRNKKLTNVTKIPL